MRLLARSGELPIPEISVSTTTQSLIELSQFKVELTGYFQLIIFKIPRWPDLSLRINHHPTTSNVALSTNQYNSLMTMPRNALIQASRVSQSSSRHLSLQCQDHLLKTSRLLLTIWWNCFQLMPGTTHTSNVQCITSRSLVPRTMYAIDKSTRFSGGRRCPLMTRMTRSTPSWKRSGSSAASFWTSKNERRNHQTSWAP